MQAWKQILKFLLDYQEIESLSTIIFNPNQTKGGRNQDAACLDALPVQ